MEGLLDLLPLLFVAAYYLLRGRKRVQDRQRATQASRAEERTVSAPKGPTPFQQFLQQLDEAVSDAARPAYEDSTPELPPRPSPLPAPPAKPVRPASEFHAITGSFDALAPVDHGRHGFGAENPLSEERFEQRAPQSRTVKRGPLPDPHGLRPAPAAPPLPELPHWRAKLRDPKAVKEAFVLQTIFGPRGGRNYDRR